MAHATTIARPVAGQQPGASSRWSPSAILGQIARYYRLQKAEHELRALDDRLLADIGITRGEIYQRVWGASRR